MSATVEIGVAGYYELCVVGEDGNIKQRFNCEEENVPKEPIKNVITDYYLAALAADSNFPGSGFFAILSTSVGTPATTDTTMPGVVAAQTATGGTNTTTGSGTTWYTQFAYSFAFAKNAYVGTFSTVGISLEADGTKLLSRLRLVDGGGTPTSMTLVNNDQLTLTYILKTKRPNVIVSGSVTLNSIVYAYDLIPINIDDGSLWPTCQANRWFTYNYYYGESGYLCTYTTAQLTVPTDMLTPLPEPAGQLSYDNRFGFTHYLGQPYYDAYAIFDVNTANGNIASITLGSSNAATGIWMVCKFTPSIPKINTQVLTLTWRFTFGRI